MITIESRINMNKKFIILSIVVALLVVTTITISSYAYFSIANNEGTESVITSGNMTIRLIDGDKITTNNMTPGDYIEKEFSVENTGNIDSSYNVYLSEVINTFVDRTDLVYEISSLDGGYNTSNQTQVPNIATKIIDNYPIGVGITHHYKLKVTFLNKNENQDDNQGKVFSSKIQVNEYKDIQTTVNYYLDNVLVNDIPTKENSNYINSTCDKNGSITFDTNNWTYTTNISQNNTTCNMYFEIPEYTLTYDYNYEGVTYDSQQIKKGQPYGTLPLPTRSGYELLGWFTEPSGGTQVYSTNIVSDNITIYAHWLKIYKDTSGGSYPELYEGLIPVKYNANGDTVVADLKQEWYNYDNHEWANAVLVKSTARNKVAGQILSQDEILQYYVWIPRYKYTLWNAQNGISNEQMINVEFENVNTPKSTGTANGQKLTHPAFTFGNTELNGFWVGKFEMTGSIGSNSLTILPNVQSLTNINLNTMFNSLRNLDIQYASNYGLDSNQIDTHVMKNMEWGAVAYLSNSKYGRYNSNGSCVSGGCEVWSNTYVDGVITKTGCAGNYVSGNTGSTNYGKTCNSWITTNGKHASTTDNQYGIYDMSGGASEGVMGNVAISSTYSWNKGGSSLNEPNRRYYDAYTNTANNSRAIEIGKLGDATREVKKNNNYYPGIWFNDYAGVPYSGDEWFLRGGYYGGQVSSGIFAFNAVYNGGASSSASYRAVLTSQDGNANS